MILIIDDNKFRREKLCKDLYMQDVPAIGCSRELEKCYTKPLVTIVVDPKPNEYSKLTSGENTTYYFCAKKDIPEICRKNRIIVNRDGVISADKIKEILNKSFNINLDRDDIGPVCLYKEENEVYVGGARLPLNRNQYLITSFMIYNYGRKFSLEEIYSYLHLSRKLQLCTFGSYISMINSKSQKVYRGKIITSYMSYYELSPHIVKAIDRVKKLKSQIKQ